MLGLFSRHSKVTLYGRWFLQMVYGLILKILNEFSVLEKQDLNTH